MAKDDIIVAVTDEQLPTVDEALVGFFEWASEVKDAVVIARLVDEHGDVRASSWSKAGSVEVSRFSPRGSTELSAIDVAASGTFDGWDRLRIGDICLGINDMMAGEATDDTRWTGRLKIWFVEDCEPRVLELSIATIEKLVEG